MKNKLLFIILLISGLSSSAQTAALRESEAFLKNFCSYHYRYNGGQAYATCTGVMLDNYFLSISIDNIRIANNGTVTSNMATTIAFDTRDISAVTLLDSLMEFGQAVLWNVGFKTKNGKTLISMLQKNNTTPSVPPYQQSFDNYTLSFGHRDVAARFREIAKKIFK